VTKKAQACVKVYRRAKTRFDVAQAAAISELSKGQAEELIPTREVFDVAIALVTIDADLELVARDEIQKLRKNGSAKIHVLSPKEGGKQQNHARSDARN
jgi:hypothetical protein